MKFKMTTFLIPLFFLWGCTTETQLKQQLKNIIKDDPEIIIEAINSKPVAFMEALQKAAKLAQESMAKKKEEEEQKKLEQAFTDPLEPEIRKDENVRGPKNAPILLVEYSDFECPFCSRAFNTVQSLRDKYGDKLRFVYKHLPLSFHPAALITAKYYEAIRLQNPNKAWDFHDIILKEQRNLKKGENYLKSVAKKLGMNMAKLEKDLNSEVVKRRIDEDQQEAAKFGFQGTPGFIINGIPVKGAYPKEHFVDIVEELKKRGKITL